MGQIRTYTEQTSINDSDNFVLQDGASNVTKKVLASTMRTKFLGSGLDAWDTYTPTLNNVTQGTSPTLLARFKQTGKIVEVHVYLIFGTGGAVTGQINFTLPVTAHSSYTSGDILGVANLYDTGTAAYPGSVEWASSTSVSLSAWVASGTYLTSTSTSATVPFTFVVGKKFIANFSYEAA